jgi:hypothetical protein
MKTSFLVIILVFMAGISLKAQDKIYRKNGKVLEVKIIEIGSTDIKYKQLNEPDGPVYVLETDRVKKIITADGKTQTFTDNLKDIESYEGQKTKAIKINFFSPLYGYTEFGFEKSVGVGKSYEVSFGIIGLGKSEQINYYSSSSNISANTKRGQAGGFISAGYKFNKLPDFIFFGRTKMSHLMQGTYFKPTLYLGYYKENIIVTKGDINTETFLRKQGVNFGALQLELGKQRVFGEKFVLDTYFGVGYGLDNKTDIHHYESPYSSSKYHADYSAFNYANSRIGYSPSLSFSFGIKFGILIK